MPKQFDFSPLKIENTVRDFRKVILDKEQREIIDDLASFISKYIALTENVLSAFIHISVSMWQNESKRLLLEIATASPEERIETVLAISDYLKKILSGILNKHDELDELEQAIDDGIALYRSKWSER